MTTSTRSSASLVATTLLIASLAGCADRTAPPTPAAIRPADGANQVAPAGGVLPQPIVAEVVDEQGEPVAGVQVTWMAESDGRVFPVSRITDQSGRVGARWVLGPRAGPNRATVTTGGVAPAAFTALAESPDEVPIGAIRLVHPPTYDGSGQMVHPDFARSAGQGFGHPDHLAITPYPFGDAKFENPSLFVAEGRPDRWILEAGTPNPVAHPDAGYLSDPDVVFDPDAGELRLYYRQAASENIIWLTRSRDGVHWGEPVEVARRPNHQIVSPAVVRRGAGDWLMWSVNAGTSGCGAQTTTVELRRSADGVTWSAPVAVALEQAGLWPWHIDVRWIPERHEFWALYNAKLAQTCTTPVVFIATSPDGITWRPADRPVITKGRIAELADVVYRSTLDYDAATDVITFWYSGARYDGGRYVWSAAVERRLRPEVFAPDAGAAAAEVIYTPGPAPLDDWP
jgi:hypothetical protein